MCVPETVLVALYQCVRAQRDVCLRAPFACAGKRKDCCPVLPRNAWTVQKAVEKERPQPEAMGAYSPLSSFLPADSS